MCIRDRGKYEHADEVSASDDSITVCGKEIKIYAFPDANNCPWGELHIIGNRCRVTWVIFGNTGFNLTN